MMDQRLRLDLVKKQMYECFIPLLHQILRYTNPELYDKWQGNCCRQTAIFGAFILNKLLPDYEWEVWDGEFDDIVYGVSRHYNHAWIYGRPSPYRGGRGLFVDLSRQHHERLFEQTDKNEYPADNSSYMYMKETSREQLPWKDLIDDPDVREYYTNMPNGLVARVLWERMNYYEK